MIFYLGTTPIDSSIEQVIHGFRFPPYFFDTPAARDHWGITEQPILTVVEEVTLPEAVSEEVLSETEEAAVLDETVSEEVSVEVITEEVKPSKRKVR